MKRDRKRWIWKIIAVVTAVYLAHMWCPDYVFTVCAKERSVEKEENAEEVAEMILDEINMNEIDQVLEDVFPYEKVTFEDVLEALLDDEDTIPAELLYDFVTDTLFGTVKANKSAMIYLLFIAIVAAVFTNFSNVFSNQQIAETGFYIVYMLLITACLQSFKLSVDTVSESLENLLIFMRVLGPAYFLSMAVATGSVSGTVFYQIVLLLIFLVEMMILHFLIPFIHVYLMIQILNFLSGEEYLSKLAELVETAVAWTLKTLLACITGISVIQGLLGPAMDSVKRSALTRGAEAIPVIGDAIGGVTEVVLGTAVLIKNGIGMAGALIIICICMVPILNMGILTLMYKGIAAIIQPVSDKRIVEAIGSVGAGYQLLLKTVFTTVVLFLITLAVAAASTS